VFFYYIIQKLALYVEKGSVEVWGKKQPQVKVLVKTLPKIPIIKRRTLKSSFKLHQTFTERLEYARIKSA
ncbi:MAG: hypothetical protein MJ196_11390, partial [Treponemataceae bacterium]|nr:hypothetical protein [Treponemataceae bacterium]